MLHLNKKYNFSKTKFLLCFFFVGMLQSSFAQITITGKVLDEQQQAIEFANVLIKQMSKDSIVNSCITDIEGKFKLVVPADENYQLTISFVGYQDWQKEEINRSVDFSEIKLSLADNLLAGVTVSAARKIIERKEDKLIFNVASSTLKENYDGMEVLERAPNVIVEQDNILLRNEAVTLMINGRILNLSGEDLANYIRNIRSEEIKSIEVKTHLSASAEGESTGGIVNIILKRKPVGFDGSVRGDYAINTQGGFRNGASMNFNYGAKQWNIYSSYRFFGEERAAVSDGDIVYKDSGDLLLEEGIWERQRQRHNYQLGFVIDAIKNHVFGMEFYGTNFKNISDNNNSIRLLNNNVLLDAGKAKVDGSTIFDLYNLTANYTWKIDTLGSVLRGFADFSNQVLDGKSTAISSYEEGLYEDNTERNNASSNTTIYAGQVDVEKYFLKGFKLETGTKLTFTQRDNSLESGFLSNEEWVTSDRSNDYLYDENVLAVYAALSKKIGKRSFVKIGLRVENTNLKRTDLRQAGIIRQNYTNWLPSVFFSHDFTDHHSVSFSYAKRLRRPPFFRINNNVIKVNDFRFELGNPDLTPEYVHRFGLNFNYKKQSLSAYYHKTVDAINGIYFLEDQVAFYKPFNAGSQTQLGLEYNRSNNLTRWWYLKVRLGVYQRKFTNEENVDSFERVTGAFNLNSVFKIDETTKIDISAAYRSPSEDAFYIAFETYSINLFLQKQLFAKRLNCRIYVNDIFNTLIYKSSRPFDSFTSNNSYKPPTQSVRFWLGYNFASRNKVSKRRNQSKNEALNRL